MCQTFRHTSVQDSCFFPPPLPADAEKVHFWPERKKKTKATSVNKTHSYIRNKAFLSWISQKSSNCETICGWNTIKIAQVVKSTTKTEELNCPSSVWPCLEILWVSMMPINLLDKQISSQTAWIVTVCYFHVFILLKEEEVEEGRNTVWIKLIAQIAHFKQNSLTKSRLQFALETSHVWHGTKCQKNRRGGADAIWEKWGRLSEGFMAGVRVRQLCERVNAYSQTSLVLSYLV